MKLRQIVFFTLTAILATGAIVFVRASACRTFNTTFHTQCSQVNQTADCEVTTTQLCGGLLTNYTCGRTDGAVSKTSGQDDYCDPSQDPSNECGLEFANDCVTTQNWVCDNSQVLGTCGWVVTGKADGSWKIITVGVSGTVQSTYTAYNCIPKKTGQPTYAGQRIVAKYE